MSCEAQKERSAQVAVLPSGAGSWALAGLVAALAGCAAATVQPADFTARQGAAVALIALAAVVMSFVPRRAGVAWPLAAGFAMATTYRLAYDPMLPDALMARMPMRLALLEPTVPMVVALMGVGLWAVWPRGRMPAGPASEAIAALKTTGQLAVGLGLVMYVALAGIYDLEGGYWLWRLVVAAALYLGLMWMGIEGAARGMVRPLHAAVMFAGVLISVGRTLAGGGGA